LLYQPGCAADRGDAAVGKGDEDEGVGHGGNLMFCRVVRIYAVPSSMILEIDLEFGVFLRIMGALLR
jgi:hypothetical protein